ncbi:MAG: Fe2+-dependent dioxygenase [Oscillatoriales cyanobacterium]|nr:MAG: Fe2+-dependent dioxygenase [Oscillatoriales cyanobacterium]
MLFQLPNLLTSEALTDLRHRLAAAQFIDGKLTAGWHAKSVKANEQLAAQDTIGTQVKTTVREALWQHPLFQAAVRPRVIHSLLVSRYSVGMSYGRHVDNAQMQGHRTDVSLTVFLSEPSEYDGGELVIESADREQGYKLDAGSAIIYPATTLHRVDPVTRGDRLVVVGWVQSWVRDASQREILFDLDTAQRSLFARDGKTAEFDLIAKSQANLLRRWTE